MARRLLVGKNSRTLGGLMETFGQIQRGKRFKYKSKHYTKIDETTGVSINNNRQKAKFFTPDVMVFVDN